MPPPPEEASAQAEEILRRLPPDEPGSLVRASLVCKPWRTLVTSPEFARSYREFHRIPPLLGFFENHDKARVCFEPSTPTSPFLPIYPDHRQLFVLDCRHGLVLMRTPVSDSDEAAERLIVWDPVGRRQWEFPPPEFANRATIIDDNAVVFCAADGCDHRSCHGGRFLVAYVGTKYEVAHASVYSSEIRAWSRVASCHSAETNLEIAGYRPKVLLGNVIYFNCIIGSTILRFDYVSLELSVMHGPGIGMPEHPASFLMIVQQGVLGCATTQGSGIFCLWSMDTALDGSVAWSQVRVIDIEMMLPSSSTNVIGFADGTCFYLSTASGIFTVDLMSGGVKNILPRLRNVCSIPYMRFYTPDQATAITLPSTRASSSEGDGWKEVPNGVKEGEQQEGELLEAAQEFYSKGSEAFQDLDFVTAVDYLRQSLRHRVAHHGKLSPKCRDTYYRYGWALLRKAEAWSASNKDSLKVLIDLDLDLARKMLHVARVIPEKIEILEKSLGRTREKVKILAALAKVSMRREDTDYSFIACYRALAILANVVEPYYRQIINLNVQMCSTFEFPGSGDAKAIAFLESRVQTLKWVNEALLADKGDEESADILFVTNILLSALDQKLEGPEQAISTPVSEASGEQYQSLTCYSQFSGSSNTTSTAETTGTSGSTETDLEAAGRGSKRANVEQTYAEPCPKKFAEDSPDAESDSSNSTDGQSRSTAQDGSLSE